MNMPILEKTAIPINQAVAQIISLKVMITP